MKRISFSKDEHDYLGWLKRVGPQAQHFMTFNPFECAPPTLPPLADAKPANAFGKRVRVKLEVQASAAQVAIRIHSDWQYNSFPMAHCDQ